MYLRFCQICPIMTTLSFEGSTIVRQRQRVSTGGKSNNKTGYNITVTDKQLKQYYERWAESWLYYRMGCKETIMTSYNHRLQIERRHNVPWNPVSCLADKLGIDELPNIEIAHNLRDLTNGTRSLSEAFSVFWDVSLANSLKGTPFGISRECPPEITRARQVLWSRFKEAWESLWMELLYATQPSVLLTVLSRDHVSVCDSICDERKQNIEV